MSYMNPPIRLILITNPYKAYAFNWISQNRLLLSGGLIGINKLYLIVPIILSSILPDFFLKLAIHNDFMGESS